MHTVWFMWCELSRVESNHSCSSEICVFWFRQNVRAIQCEQFYKLDEMNATAAHRNTSHDFRKITRTQQQKQQQTNKNKEEGKSNRFWRFAISVTESISSIVAFVRYIGSNFCWRKQTPLNAMRFEFFLSVYRFTHIYDLFFPHLPL